MWNWFHPGWIVILPLAMMALCILMCFLMRRLAFGGCSMCCGHRHSKPDAESERKAQSDSRGSTA